MILLKFNGFSFLLNALIKLFAYSFAHTISTCMSYFHEKLRTLALARTKRNLREPRSGNRH